MSDTSEHRPIQLHCSRCGTSVEYVIAPVMLSDGTFAKGVLSDWHFVVCDSQQWQLGFAVVQLICPDCFAGDADAFYVHLPTWLSP